MQVGEKTSLKVGQADGRLRIPAGIEQGQEVIDQAMGLLNLLLGDGLFLF